MFDNASRFQLVFVAADAASLPTVSRECYAAPGRCRADQVPSDGQASVALLLGLVAGPVDQGARTRAHSGPTPPFLLYRENINPSLRLNRRPEAFHVLGTVDGGISSLTC